MKLNTYSFSNLIHLIENFGISLYLLTKVFLNLEISPSLLSMQVRDLFKPCLHCFTLSQRFTSFSNIFSLSFAKNRLSLWKDHNDLKAFSALYSMQ